MRSWAVTLYSVFSYETVWQWAILLWSDFEQPGLHIFCVALTVTARNLPWLFCMCVPEKYCLDSFMSGRTCDLWPSPPWCLELPGSNMFLQPLKLWRCIIIQPCDLLLVEELFCVSPSLSQRDMYIQWYPMWGILTVWQWEKPMTGRENMCVPVTCRCWRGSWVRLKGELAFAAAARWHANTTRVAFSWQLAAAAAAAAALAARQPCLPASMRRLAAARSWLRWRIPSPSLPCLRSNAHWRGVSFHGSEKHCWQKRTAASRQRRCRAAGGGALKRSWRALHRALRWQLRWRENAGGGWLAKAALAAPKRSARLKSNAFAPAALALARWRAAAALYSRHDGSQVGREAWDILMCDSDSVVPSGRGKTVIVGKTIYWHAVNALPSIQWHVMMILGSGNGGGWRGLRGVCCRRTPLVLLTLWLWKLLFCILCDISRQPCIVSHAWWVASTNNLVGGI